jgi:hypothetical protein
MKMDGVGLSAEETTVLTGVHTEYYGHLRHLESMRSQYTNLFVIIAGGVLTVASGSVASGAVGSGTIPIVRLAGLLIALVGLFSLGRVFRWSGHILHDIRRIEAIHDLIDQAFPSLQILRLASHQERRGGLFPAFFRFDRLFDQYVTAIISIGGVILVWAAGSPGDMPARIAAGSLVGAGAVVIAWQEAARIVLSEHRECCFRYDFPARASAAAGARSSQPPAAER